MNYQGFEVKIQASPEGGYTKQVLDSPYSETPPEPFHLPFSPQQLETWPELIEQWRKDQPADSGLPAPEEIGEALFQSLFSGEVGKRFHKSLAYVEAQDRTAGLRILLHFDLRDPGLLPVAAFPWELLCDGECDDFLSRNRRTPVARFFKVNRPPLPDHSGPLRVLVVQAAPSDLDGFDLAASWRSIWQASESNPDIEIQSLAHPTFDELACKLQDESETWHVLHFIGHGAFFDANREGHLCFETSEGKNDRIPGTLLGEILKSSLPDLRLVFLNSCVSGVMRQHEKRGPLAGVVPALLKAGVPAIIAMQAPINSEAAIKLSAAFYTRVAAHDPVDAALASGRLALLHSHPFEWATPVLFTRVADANILGSAKPMEPTATPSSQPGRREPGFLRLGIRTFWDTEGRIAWGKEMDEECEDILDLRHDFTGEGYRYIKDQAAWNTVILPKLHSFLSRAATTRRPLHLNFAAHSSLAFAAGYILEAKSGLDITIRQRGKAGIQEWRTLLQERPEGALLQSDDFQEDTQDHQGVALALSVTRPILPDVQHYLSNTGLNARILPATIAGGPSQTSLRSGIHALRLAEVVAAKLEERTAREKTGILHIFAAAPNALLFFLGQLLTGSGRIQLYEHDFYATGLPGAYQPSILLPSQ